MIKIVPVSPAAEHVPPPEEAVFLSPKCKIPRRCEACLLDITADS